MSLHWGSAPDPARALPWTRQGDDPPGPHSCFAVCTRDAGAHREANSGVQRAQPFGGVQGQSPCQGLGQSPSGGPR